MSASSSAFVCAPAVTRKTMHRHRPSQRRFAVAAAAPSDFDKAAANIGLDSREGVFGFTPFAELWVGRLAMLGFASGVSVELLTGNGILRQIGLETPNSTTFTALCALIFGGSIVGAANTLTKVQNGEMTFKQFKRYVDLFGADTDEVAAKLSIDLKKMGDFTSPDKMRDIIAARVGGNPADTVLALDASAALKTFDSTTAAAAEAKAAATPEPVLLFEQQYALDIEMNNGRWAMIGFALAVLIEASTGGGVVDQFIFYGKVTGLLGADSGF